MQVNLQELLDKVGWSDSEAARRLDVHRNTVAHWVKVGDAPGSVVVLLQLLIKHRELLEEFS